MKKSEILELEANAHLSINELRQQKPHLTAPLDDRLEKRVSREVAARMAGKSEKLRKLVEEIKIPVDKESQGLKLRDTMLAAIRQSVDADRRLAIDTELAKELDELASAPEQRTRPGAKHDPTLADSLRLNDPIAFHPEFRKEIEAAKLFRLSDATGLGDNTAELLIKEVGKPAEITGARLEHLIKDGKLTDRAAEAVGAAASLYNVLDERPELVAAAKASVGDVRELVKLDKAAWTRLIADSKTKPPGRIATDAYAELLSRKVTRLFPTDALSHRLSGINVRGALADATERDALTNRFSAMKIRQVLDDGTLSDAKRAAEVTRRVDLATKFFGENQDVLGMDLTPGSRETRKLKFDAGASDQDRTMVLATARMYQRALTVTDDITDAESLVAGGYPSALSLATSRPKEIAARAGVPEKAAARYYETAKRVAAGVTAQAGTIVDLVGGPGGSFARTPAGNISTSVLGYLKEIPGFDDFFGNQSFCNCKHCQSILGPAAYFVDLMCFVDEKITQEFFADKPNHPLNLKIRRPDLWTLELTCDNTNTPIPYLVIINEILENAVARHTGFAGNFADRVAVGTRVYRDTLVDRVDSFRQPLNLPFEELRTFLRHFQRSLADLADAGHATGDALARLRLALSPRDFDLITSQTNTDLAFLRRIYGVQFTQAGAAIQKFDAQKLLDPMGVTRDELGELVKTWFVTANGTVNIQIVGEKQSAESVQNDIEKISGLTRPALDRMHRFVRLWRATGWRIGELDLVLAHVEAADLGDGLDAATVRAVAAVHRLQVRSGQSVDATVALWSTVPRRPVLRSLPTPPFGSDDAPPSYASASPLARLLVPLFDRFFNQESFVDADGAYPKPATTFLHPALAAVPPAETDPNLHRLLASLGVSEDQLLQLILGLQRPLGIDPASNIDADKQFALSEPNLSLLFRHTRLARLLKITVPELFALAAIADGIVDNHVAGLADLESLLRVRAWTDASDWTLAEIIKIRRPGPVAPPLPQPEVPDAGDMAAALVAHVAASESLLFTETAFALLPPTSPVATSAGPGPATAGGESVTYTAVLAGESREPETVTLAANADLGGVVADWNSKATLTRAFRSDAAGKPVDTGTHLSITVTGARGSSTRIVVSASAAPLFSLGEVTGAEVTEGQSRELFTANTNLFEVADARGRYRLKAGFDPAAPLVMPATFNAALAPALLDILRGFHSTRLVPSLLPTAVNADSAALTGLLAMLGVNSGDDVLYRELRGDVPPAQLQQLIENLRPLALLFKDAAAFDPGTVEFVAQQPALFEIADFRTLSTAAIQNVETFRTLRAASARRSQTPPDLQQVLRSFAPATLFAAADQADLAALLDCDEGLLQSLTAHLTFAATPLAALRQLRETVALAKHVGVGGSAIKLAQSAVYADLSASSAALQAAFRAKYPDESEWEKQVEPFRDALLSRRRDGLVAYLVHSGPQQFDEVSDLYHYFLLDVELEGCARTSRVASAIDTMQLYVHRCLMNLEETPPGAADPVHVLPASVPIDEWDWRKNYRVWEANRKIFLYPENYIEPELRDDKTPLFKELEEELLSKEITSESILEAYARYLRGFDELAHLTIAGSYHEKDEDAQRDVLHLCGVTSDEPPTFYYRRVENAHYGANSDEVATHWGAWEKMDVQVPATRVSPIVHRGQLYVFWNRYTTKPKNDISGGSSTFAGYEHRGALEFSKRRLDGSWTAPQKIALESAPFTPISHPSWYATGGIISDPIVSKNDTILGFTITIRIGGLFVNILTADAQGRVWDGALPVLQLPPEIVASTEETTLIGDGYSVVVTPIWQTILNTPLYDFQPHPESKSTYSLTGFGWDRPYPGTDGSQLSVRAFNFQMHSAIDLYRLNIGDQLFLESEGTTVEDRGVPWFNPGVVALRSLLIYLCTCGKVNPLEDLVAGRLVWSKPGFDKRLLHKTNAGLACFDTYSFAAVLLNASNVYHFKRQMATSGPWTEPQWDDTVTDYLMDQLSENPIGEMPSGGILDVVNGSINDVIMQSARDAAYLQSGVRADGRYHLRRLNTSLSEPIADMLFNRGLSDLLATATQLSLEEASTAFAFDEAEVHDATGTGTVDFNGSMGSYLREIFFHVPFLIADYLNSQGRFEDAQRWYHYIFDPTAAETVSADPADSAEEQQVRALDRNWRYREFRNLTAETLRHQLTNAQALEAYRREPFNPHAIARLRLSAYQKAVVLKYADNLIGWGDDLFIKAFATLNPEYLRWASLKYITAQEILGERPALLGDCGEGGVRPRNFATIAPHLAETSEFLMEMESTVVVKYRAAHAKASKGGKVLVEADRAEKELGSYAKASPVPGIEAADRRTPATERVVMGLMTKFEVNSEKYREDAAHFSKADFAVMKPAGGKKTLSAGGFDVSAKGKGPAGVGVGMSVVRQINPIFCVPGNDRLWAHWDRVADRLYKLRHCMDIDGVYRQLPLFAPPIDPGLLVAGRAAGLSVEDMLGLTAGALPPYRFRYLIEKARGYAATVQAFGAALLGALEKRDSEELARLRNTQQKNILALTTEVKRQELKIAEHSVDLTTLRQSAAQERFDYYDGLISSGLSVAEIIQTSARVHATVAEAATLGLNMGAAITSLVPRVGSPFAMVYGGEELSRSLTAWARVTAVPAKVAELSATIAGIAAGFERREEGWEHSKETAENELKAIEVELKVAELRRAMAARGLELHEKTMDQHDEILEFYDGKFSNFGLYTYLSRSLQQLHRESYSNALAVARLAEQAYRFERPGDNSTFVGGEWNASRSGLLAGERLNLALQTMDKRFIETNARNAEINQSFSVAQINPGALIDLKEIGSCEFELPEFFFDMFYPGQYRRRMMAVRLTIPCITGPYTNVSATLTLLRSHIRRDPVLGEANLLEVPSTGTTSVATSTAQGDAGVFELSFRDERYMPFEGAGAISRWRLELPSQFRPFDYQTINDVILNISYTAAENRTLRADVESQNDALAGSLLHYLSTNSLTRVFSLRQEFSSAFNRLMQAAVGTPVTFDLTERHFPLFVQGRALTATAANIVLVLEDRTATVGSTSISVNTTAASAFPAPTNPPAAGDPFGGLPNKAITPAFATGLKGQHSITVDDAGNLAPAGGAAGLEPDKLRDIILVVQYRL